MNSLYTISDDYKFQSVASARTLVAVPTTSLRPETSDKPTQEKTNPTQSSRTYEPLQDFCCERCSYADIQEREYLTTQALSDSMHEYGEEFH
jgi:hypothetical protein